MTITFDGAARNVTGSMHLIEAGGRRVLLDCGLMQGRRREVRQVNEHFPFDAASIDAIVLSHAHIDHSGNLPGIVKQGYRGPIFSTPATRDLCSIMLQDSAFLQEKDAEHLAKREREFIAPLYTVDDAHAALALFHTVPYHKTFPVAPGVACTFFDAGHILGSASMLLEVTEGGRTVRVAFSGDYGRKNRPIIRDPEQIAAADVLLLESTYGDRLHEPATDADEKLARTMRETAEAGGRVIVPAFSVGRTQDLLYTIRGLVRDGRAPDLPVFVDSPLSTNATGVYKMHAECFDAETRRRVMQIPDALGFDHAHYIASVEDSKRLNDLTASCMVISASGMCEGGRILHHLAHGIGDARNAVLIVGYQSPETLGRRLVEKAPRVKIYGDEYPVRARVVTLNGMSAHGDQHDLVEFATHFDRRALRAVHLVHGDPERQTPLQAKLHDAGIANVTMPARGDVVPL